MEISRSIDILVSSKSASLTKILSEVSVNTSKTIKIKDSRAIDQGIFKSSTDIVIFDLIRLSSGLDKVKYIEKMLNVGIYVVAIGESSKELQSIDSQNFLLVKSVRPIKILTFLEKTLQGSNTTKSPYLSINPLLLLRKATLPCDIFLRMAGDKYIKLFAKDNETDRQKIEQYIAKGVRYFFVSNDDFYEHCTPLFEANLVDDSLYEGPVDAYIKSTEIIHSMVTDLGVSELVLNQVNNVANATMLLFLNDKELSKMTDLFKRPEGQFIYSHSYLALTFSMMLLSKQDWKDKKFHPVLAQAALLHDLGYTHPEYANYDSYSADELKKLPKEIRDEVRNHAAVMGEKLRKNPKIGDNTLNIVERHHEGFGSNSYPRGLSSSTLNQLECLFIICHHFSLGLFKISFNQRKVANLVDEICTEFDTGAFRKLLSSFKETFGGQK